MKINNKATNQASSRQTQLLIITLSMFLLLSGLSPLFASLPTNYINLRSSTTLKATNSLSIERPRLYQNLTEGEGDLAAFVVADDGSLIASMIATGSNIGGLDTSAAHYDECLIAISLFRWQEYENVIGYLLDAFTNETDGGMSDFLGFIDLLPPNALFMVFGGGTDFEIGVWSEAIRQEFQSIYGLPFEPVLDLPTFNISGMVFAVSAYGYSGTDIQGRDAFQTFTTNLGSSRRGASELVTPTLANDSQGGVGMLGFVNIGAFGTPSPIKAPLQAPESITVTGWVSLHKDKFYGSEEQEFNVNEFCDRTGPIGIGSLDFFEFNMLFPTGVNITSVDPPDMTNSSTPEGVSVTRNTTLWQSTPDPDNIIVRFEGDFPPGLTITKSITGTMVPGGTATVTITVENIDQVETAYNIFVDDSGSWSHYTGMAASRLIFTGNLTHDFGTLGPGGKRSFYYLVKITTEGTYISTAANVTYEDDTATTYEKESNRVHITVRYANIMEFLLTIFRDIPWSIPILLVIGLMILYAIIALIKGLLGMRTKKGPPPPPAEYAAEPTIPEAPIIEEPPPPPEISGATCINCGSPLPPGVTFCPACGAKIPE